MQRELRVGLLTRLDPVSRRSWSGSTFHLRRALISHGVDVIDLGPLNPFQKPLGRSLEFISSIVPGSRWGHAHSWLLARAYARSAIRLIETNPVDVILAPIASTEIAALPGPMPVVYYSDGTFALMSRHYARFHGLSARSRREGHEIESAAIRRASASIFTTRWAADSATTDHGADGSRVHVAPFGANLDEPPTAEMALASKPRDRCELLFVAARWTGKGGDIAFETLSALKRRGVDARLTLCGTRPRERLPKDVEAVRFLDKDDAGDREIFDHLMRRSHFLLHPSRFDASAIVCSEASAYGIPVVAARTGGMADVVEEGLSGHLLPPEARGEAYAEVIQRAWQDESGYARMCAHARDRFEKVLNWDAWAATVVPILAAAAQKSVMDVLAFPASVHHGITQVPKEQAMERAETAPGSDGDRGRCCAS